jgi:hypothetical protein
MRNALKGSHNKVIWLVRFLEIWCKPQELKQRAQQQIQILSQGHYAPKAAYYWTSALISTQQLDKDTEQQLLLTTKKYLEPRSQSLAQELSKIAISIPEIKDNSIKSLVRKIKNLLTNSFYFSVASLYETLKGNKKTQKKKYRLKGEGEKFKKFVSISDDIKRFKEVAKDDVGTMNSLAWFYFERQQNRDKALLYAQQAVEKQKSIYNAHTLACIHLWHKQIESALQIATEFMNW